MRRARVGVAREGVASEGHPHPHCGYLWVVLCSAGLALESACVLLVRGNEAP